ncbi:MAG: transcription repressor NadR [Bacillota bacterium]|nr:transcription repressor NadR [Bacillota bacterium]
MSEYRRKAIIKQLEDSDRPITGSELAEVFDVSRQVIVQDIAIIRASGLHVMATSNGYLIPKLKKTSHLIKTFVSKHNGFDNMEEELEIIVEYGGKVIDVIVEHPVYGEIVGTLHISNKEDVDKFLKKVKESGANPLSILTQGDHIHTIEVPSEKVFRLIMDELRAKGYVE